MGDAITALLVRAGAVPYTFLLTTHGRRTGRARTVPVTVVQHEGTQYLVAPYGVVGWVHNVRADGRVMLLRRGQSHSYVVSEATPEEAGPVLKKYVAISRPTRPYFVASPDAPVAAFVAEADRHPVFRLAPGTWPPCGHM